jgi:transposase
VLVLHRLQRDVASDFRMSASFVSALCKKAEKKRGFLQELMNARDDKAEKAKDIQNTVDEMNNSNVFIDSAASIKKHLSDIMGIESDEKEIRRILNQEMGMKYRKIVPVSIHGNSQKNLVLR